MRKFPPSQVLRVARSARRRARAVYLVLRRTWGFQVRARTPFQLAPTSVFYGFDRGTPIDRRYIEQFLERFGASSGYATGLIRGRVLEVGGRDYVDQFGVAGDASTPGTVARVDVLHANASNPEATIVGDLTDPACLPEGVFDCIICTQTLHVIYDWRAALETLHRGLAEGGTLLLTAPGITSSCLPDRDEWGDWWRFTSGSLRRMLGEVFRPEDVYVEAYGNVQAASAFLYGIAAEEMPPEHLDSRDPNFEVLLAARAVKRAAGGVDRE